MLRPRIIPCLLVRNGGLVKTVKFTEPKYVGDPINAVRIFNEKEVDELMVLDIDATRLGHLPNVKMIKHLASECRMPLCYGGGVRTADQVVEIIGLGVEKVALSAAAVERPALIAESALRVGRQSIVVVIDVKRTGLLRRYEVITHNATRPSGFHPVDFARRVAGSGAGEIVISSVDRDGTMTGYDLDLIDQVRAAVDVPVTVLGGAGTLTDLQALFKHHPVIGAAAGSLFVFKGKYRAVLINYPDHESREALYPSRFD